MSPITTLIQLFSWVETWVNECPRSRKKGLDFSSRERASISVFEEPMAMSDVLKCSEYEYRWRTIAAPTGKRQIDMNWNANRIIDLELAATSPFTSTEFEIAFSTDANKYFCK